MAWLPLQKNKHITLHYIFWKEAGKTNVARGSFTRSAAKIWNQAPQTIKDCITLSLAKKAIKSYCQTLPV